MIVADILAAEHRQPCNRDGLGELESGFLYGDLELVNHCQAYIDAITDEVLSAIVVLFLMPDGLVQLIQLPEASDE